MKEKVEKILPFIEDGKFSKPEIEELTNSIRNAIKENPSQGKELGQLIYLINKAVKSQADKTLINLQPVNGGFIAIGHKPGGKLSFEGMKKMGVTVILTLLQENEGATQIGNHVKKVNIDWLWFPFSASKPHDKENLSVVFDLFKNLQNLLATGNKIYIHCSAGIHRTGMITYGLLRYLGQNKAQAKQTLLTLREVTAGQVGEERLEWGDQFGDMTGLNK